MSQRKLLLADDSITIQKVVNLTFADEGIEVITVGDGDSAMAKLAEISPDLVMADVNMPGLNGYQICERIRQSDALRQTPVILLVGSFEPFDESEAERVGANDYLTKPFQSIRQLVAKVTDLLETAGKQNGETAAASHSEVAQTESADLENARTLDNFVVPQEYFEAAPAAGAEQFSSQRDDVAMDDELIEASPASSFALDESMKFESSEINEAEETGAPKTQPLSPEDLQQFSFTRQPEETELIAPAAEVETGFEAHRNTADNASAANVSDYESTTTQEEEQMAKPQSAPAFFNSEDEDDLLEIPFDEDEEEWEEPENAVAAASETEPAAESGQTAETFAGAEQSAMPASPEWQEQSGQPETVTNAAAASFEQSQTPFDQNQPAADSSAAANAVEAALPPQLSPEMIDAIAQKVVEKLSDRAVKDVAWEVVPQMADLIIKKMTEEKLKQ